MQSRAEFTKVAMGAERAGGSAFPPPIGSGGAGVFACLNPPADSEQMVPFCERASSRVRAVIVIPHLSADLGAWRGLCRLLNRAGISCLEIIRPYHGPCAPKGCGDASSALSADLVQTIAWARQAVLEIRRCADWLESRGFRSIGLLGASRGWSYVALAAAHDSRFSSQYPEPLRGSLAGDRVECAVHAAFLGAYHISTFMKENLQIL